MLARIRKSMQEKDQGFTLIELLVVMIIIGILAAVAIPVFLSQRAKARDTSTKADVSTIGKEIATYFVDGTKTLVVAQTGAAGTDITVSDVADGGNYLATIKVSNGTELNDTARLSDSTAWCVSLTNDEGKDETYKYSGDTGLTQGQCVAVP